MPGSRRPMVSSGRRTGYSLLEVIVALSIAATAMLAARMLLEGIADASARIRKEAALVGKEANAERLLRTLAARAEGDTLEDFAFEGGPLEATFTTWCEVPAEWQERCRVTIALEQTETAVDLTLSSAGYRRILLRSDSTLYGLRYLSASDTGFVWLSAWEAGAGIPAALGILGLHDTTIVRVGITP